MNPLQAQSVVVPVDLSDASLQAVATAVEIAGDAAKVHVLHVLHELQAADPGVVWDAIDDEARRQHASEAVAERLRAAGIAGAPQIEVRVGDAGHCIAQYAEDVEAELIVIPSHGRRGLARMLIGSVAERVLRLASCPVLVLRAKNG